MKKISIIIPVYNEELYVEKCLRSCAEQDLSPEDYEIIVINDGTTDNSLEIVERVSKDYSNIIIHSQENQGLSAARNKGLTLAKGEYVWFVDSDDQIHPDALHVLFTKAKETSADIISFKGVEYLEGIDQYNDLPIASVGVYTSKEYLYQLLNLDVSCHLWCRLFKKDLFDNVKFPVGVIYEDALTFPYLVCEAKTVIQIEDGLYYYLMRSGSITQSKPKNVIGLINEMETLCRYLIDVKTMPDSLVRRFSSALYLIIAVTLVKFGSSMKDVDDDLRIILQKINTRKVIKDKIKKRPTDVMKIIILKTYPKLLHYIYKVADRL